MPRAKPKTPKVPGAPTPDPIADTQPNVSAPQQTAPAVPDASATQPTEAQKAAAIATVAEAKIEDTEAEVVRKQLDRAPGELPDASDVDPTKIKRSVLTKQGWVTPAPPAKA